MLDCLLLSALQITAVSGRVVMPFGHHTVLNLAYACIF